MIVLCGAVPCCTHWCVRTMWSIMFRLPKTPNLQPFIYIYLYDNNKRPQKTFYATNASWHVFLFFKGDLISASSLDVFLFKCCFEVIDCTTPSYRSESLILKWNFEPVSKASKLFRTKDHKMTQRPKEDDIECKLKILKGIDKRDHFFLSQAFCAFLCGIFSTSTRSRMAFVTVNYSAPTKFILFTFFSAVLSPMKICQ